MEKRVFFKGWWLPALLVAPQLLISFVFFFYPSGQAIWNSLFLPDPFGLKTEFVGLDNFRFLLSDPYYLASFKTTIIFSTAVSVSSMALGLYLAALANAAKYKPKAIDETDTAVEKIIVVLKLAK